MSQPEKSLTLLKACLGAYRDVAAVSILAAPILPVAELVREQLPGAALRLVVENAKDLDLVRERWGRRAEVAVGTDFSALAAGAGLAILGISGFEGKKRQRARFRSAREHLDAGGVLLVTSHTKRGAKGQLAMLREIFPQAAVAERGGGGFRVLAAHAAEVPEEAPQEEKEPVKAPREGQTLIRSEILGQSFELYTTPALFSKERIDAGTRLLLETLPAAVPSAILDLGCGYGTMGIVLARLYPQSRVTLVDVEAQAVEMARQNVAVNGVEANTEVILSDGLRELPGRRFGLVVIHFPLHIPRDDLERLLGEARDALLPGGSLYGVMLMAYELRPLLRRIFRRVETLVEKTAEESGDAYCIVAASA